MPHWHYDLALTSYHHRYTIIALLADPCLFCFSWPASACLMLRDCFSCLFRHLIMTSQVSQEPASCISLPIPCLTQDPVCRARLLWAKRVLPGSQPASVPVRIRRDTQVPRNAAPPADWSPAHTNLKSPAPSGHSEPGGFLCLHPSAKDSRILPEVAFPGQVHICISAQGLSFRSAWSSRGHIFIIPSDNLIAFAVPAQR